MAVIFDVEGREPSPLQMAINAYCGQTYREVHEPRHPWALMQFFKDRDRRQAQDDVLEEAYQMEMNQAAGDNTPRRIKYLMQVAGSI